VGTACAAQRKELKPSGVKLRSAGEGGSAADQVREHPGAKPALKIPNTQARNPLPPTSPHHVANPQSLGSHVVGYVGGRNERERNC